MWHRLLALARGLLAEGRLAIRGTAPQGSAVNAPGADPRTPLAIHRAFTCLQVQPAAGGRKFCTDPGPVNLGPGKRKAPMVAKIVIRACSNGCGQNRVDHRTGLAGRPRQQAGRAGEHGLGRVSIIRGGRGCPDAAGTAAGSGCAPGAEPAAVTGPFYQDPAGAIWARGCPPPRRSGAWGHLGSGDWTWRAPALAVLGLACHLGLAGTWGWLA